MNYSSPSFCEKAEFDTERGNRVWEEELEPDALYMAYFSLRTIVSNQKRQAAKFPVQYHSKLQLSSSGVYSVRFSFLPGPAQEQFETEMDFFEGHLARPKNPLLAFSPVDPNIKYPMALGFFTISEELENGGEGRGEEVKKQLPLYYPALV
jgi:hypothetical protein